MLKIALTIVGLIIIALLACNAWVVGFASGHVYDNLEQVPANRVGVVLGTSPYTRFGSKNLLFEHRIEAALELYRAGRVQQLLLSGANPDKTYNEPQKMYQALLKAGVPDAAMTLDYAGFRTLDSVVRAKQVFGLDRFTIISQRFHGYRAVFIARHEGLNAIAYHRSEEDARQPLRTEAREFFARAKAVIDLFVLFARPRHLGERETLNEPDSKSPSDNKAE